MTRVGEEDQLEKRLQVYREIEAYRKRPLMVYATSTRPGVQAMLAGDAVREFVEQMRAIGSAPAVDLLLHSYGGDPLAAWRIMSTLRETYATVGVLVPFAAFSAATLLALGANEIVMHPFAALGPIDPQIQARTVKGDQIAFAYEDVGAFLRFIRDEVGITEQSFLTPIVDKLFTLAEPWTIGHAKRASDLSSEIGERMLRLHMLGEKNVARSKEIAKNLNKSFQNHGDAVSRARAMGLDLPIAKPDEKLEELIWRAYAALEEYMELNTPFHPLTVFMGDAAGAASLTPVPPLALPADAPQQVQQAAWNAVLQRALQGGPAPEVPYRVVKVVVEGLRRSASIVVEGRVTAIRHGLEIKAGVIETCAGWTTAVVPPQAAPVSPVVAGADAKSSQGGKKTRRRARLGAGA